MATATISQAPMQGPPGSTGRGEVLGDGRGGRDRAEVTASVVLGRDARILRRAMLKAVKTSPDSFIMTIEEVEGRPLEYWINEIRSSTWAVAQRGKELVGLVVGKLPDPDCDREDQASTRYIESVWVTPELRGKGLGKRLINFLLETEYRKNQQVRQFLLWVLTADDAAKRMFEHMGFWATKESKRLEGSDHSTGEVEVQYCLDFAATVHKTDEVSRQQDRRLYGVTYRVLGES